MSLTSMLELEVKPFSRAALIDNNE